MVITDLSILEALEEMQHHMVACNFSQNTINDYNNSYKRFLIWLETHPTLTPQTTVREFAPRHGSQFMRWLATTKFAPGGVAERDAITLSPKSRICHQSANSPLSCN